MQSNLKKSLYLGLAALSFASVASVTANASNANAAKKHAAAKKVTYKTTNKNLDQSVTFKATGKNAVYNKAVGKRSVVASKADMASKANSKDTKDLFMAYQEGVTSKGVHYYKVVSFDKKVRGFVYNKGVAKTNTTVAADKPSNTTGYLQNTNRFFNKAYGSQFKTSLKNDYKGMNIAADQFTVSDAVKVNNDQTYYYVTDKNNQLVNGWVNSVYFSNNMTDAAKKANNSANAIHVKYVDSANLGSVLMEKDLNPANLSSAGTYSSADVDSAISNSLVGTGFVSPVRQDSNSTIAKGNTVTVTVKKGATEYLSTNNFKGVGFLNSGTVNQTEDTTDEGQLVGKFAQLQLSPDQWKQLFQGTENKTFDFNTFENSLLVPGKAWNQFSIGNKTYTYNANYTRNSDANKKTLADGSKRSMTYDEIAKDGKPNFTIFYDVKDNGNTSSNNGSINQNQYNAQQRVIKAVNDFNNGNKQLNAVVAADGSKDYKSNADLLSDIVTSKLDNGDVNALKDAANADNASKAQNDAASKVNSVLNSFKSYTGKEAADGQPATKSYSDANTKDELNAALKDAESKNGNISDADLTTAVNNAKLAANTDGLSKLKTALGI